MEQIIRNLVKNAIGLRKTASSGLAWRRGKGEVLLTVEDNGVGIPPDELPHIWDRFYRVENQRVAVQVWKKCNGLGLVIVKNLIQLQGGKIDVVSSWEKERLLPSVSHRIPKIGRRASKH